MLGRSHKWRIYSLHFLLALSWIGSDSSPAYGHAFLQRSEPAAGSAPSRAPARILLEFSEAVETEFAGIALYNSQGLQVDSGGAKVAPADPRVVELPLPDLPGGVYTVVWQVVSADGHPIEGAFGFSVGDGISAGPGARPKASSWKGLFLLLAGSTHSIAVAGFLLLAGLPLFHFLVFRYVARRVPAGQESWENLDAVVQEQLLRAMKLALGLAIAASVLSLAIQGARVSGHPAAAASPAVLYRVVAHMRFGQTWLLRMGGAALLAVLVWWAGRKAQKMPLGVCAAGAAVIASFLLLTFGLGGHPGAARGWTAVYLLGADWFHLLAAAPWLGGLWQFAFGLPRVGKSFSNVQAARLTFALVGCFPRVAVTSIVFLVFSGVCGALKHIPSWEGLFGTSYGWALLVKGALLLPVLAIASSHHLIFRTRINHLLKGESSNAERLTSLLRGFRVMVTLEFCLVAAILVAAGMLVTFSPAEVSLAARGGFFEESREVGGFRLTLRIEPRRVGINRADLSAVVLEGTSYAGNLQVQMTATMQDHDMGKQELAVRRVAQGRYHAESFVLGMAGRWEIAVLGTFEDGREIQTTFSFYVSPGSE